MLCTRCSHPLKPRTDRCLRCLALNPQDRAQPPANSNPQGPLPAAGRFDFRIDTAPPSAYRVSDDLSSVELDARAQAQERGIPPGAQIVLSFAQTSDPEGGDPSPPLPAPDAVRKAVRKGAGVHQSGGVRLPLASPGARLVSWAIDAGLILACAALHVGVAAALVGPNVIAPGGPQPLDTWVELLLFGQTLPRLWAALAAAVALAYSWLFTALGGQTPGMWIAGVRLVRVGRVPGGPVSAARALARSALALPSLCLGLFGFVLALVDGRGQTLHDKLAGCIVVEAP
jgi:uncharacterized RDD family membrane protein YckC